MKSTSTIQVKTSCHHCGDDCQQEVWKKDKVFCCEACSMVYELLQEHDLGHFYALKEANGKASTRMAPNAYAYLDHEEIAEQLLDFQDEQMAKLRFHLPDIHCAACIWLLEKLYKFDEGILQSRVHFLRKEIRLSFQPSKTSIRKIAELLARLGYPPKLKLDDLEASQPKATSQGLQLQLGIAGFVFGNIMLLSFPEYLGLDSLSESNFQHFFGYVNLLLAIPLVAYSGIDYLKSAWFALRQKNLNIDVPISLGIMTLLLRSGYDIISHSGPGYLDVLAGLIFFLLIGKWFQQKTYYHLSFERDFKAYFPISASLPDGRQLPVNALTAGDRILIRHGELIPADSLLKKGKAQIDYSFVTGEAIPLGKAIGDKLYAGGRQMGAAIEVEVLRKVSQSYLTQLWN
ncbi:MAG: heavy metal translocating P-type ATPase metal-binding domain-containing protein, partial [Bacteroidota bacterium]